MLNVNSRLSFTSTETSFKAFGLTLKEIPEFVLDNDHHVAEIWLGDRQIGIWTDSMGFAWEDTSFLKGYVAFAGHSSTFSATGFGCEADIKAALSRSGYETGKIENADGLVVGLWSKEFGFTWVNPNPFAPVLEENKIFGTAFTQAQETAVTPAIEPVIRLERAAKPVQPQAEEKPAKVDYSKFSDRELRAYIQEKLATDNQWLRRAVVAIYNLQTSDEQISGLTKHHNGVGFNGLDSGIMTNIANRIIANRRSLTPSELTACRKIMPKYIGQLVRIVREKRG